MEDSGPEAQGLGAEQPEEVEDGYLFGYAEKSHGLNHGPTTVHISDLNASFASSVASDCFPSTEGRGTELRYGEGWGVDMKGSDGVEDEEIRGGERRAAEELKTAEGYVSASSLLEAMSAMDSSAARAALLEKVGKFAEELPGSPHKLPHEGLSGRAEADVREVNVEHLDQLTEQLKQLGQLYDQVEEAAQKMEAEDVASNRSTDTSPHGIDEAHQQPQPASSLQSDFKAIVEESFSDSHSSVSTPLRSTPQKDSQSFRTASAGASSGREYKFVSRADIEFESDSDLESASDDAEMRPRSTEQAAKSSTSESHAHSSRRQQDPQQSQADAHASSRAAFLEHLRQLNDQASASYADSPSSASRNPPQFGGHVSDPVEQFMHSRAKSNFYPEHSTQQTPFQPSSDASRYSREQQQRSHSWRGSRGAEDYESLRSRGGADYDYGYSGIGRSQSFSVHSERASQSDSRQHWSRKGQGFSSSFSEGGTRPFSTSQSSEAHHDPGQSTDHAREKVYEYRCKELHKRLLSAEAEAATYADSLAEIHQVLKATVDEGLEYKRREKTLKSQIERLQMENNRHSSNREAVEQLFGQKLELLRSERDMIALQLGAAYEEIAMRDAALADSAAYMQALKRRNAELQMQLRTLLEERHIDKERAAAKQINDNSDSGIFGLAHIREKIEEAVREAAQLDESARKEKLKNLRLRWHPDKNPVLQEFATEVTKIINESVDKLIK